MTITVLYSCDGCGASNARVDVPARTTETVANWMDATMLTVARAHRTASPRCTAPVLQEVKIPIRGAEMIGGPSVN